MIQTSARGRARAPMPTAFPAIIRPAGAPRAAAPARVAEPSHHHLPAWVRRAYSQAAPILGDILGSLEGDERAELQRGVDDLTQRISDGKFSQAFQYPALISTGMQLLERQRRERADAARAARALDIARKRSTDILRDDQSLLAPDVASRLQKAVRAASSPEEVADVETQIRQATEAARTVAVRRKDREIGRTRARIEQSAMRQPANAANEGESWQDVLRRLQEQMAREESGS